MCIVGSMLIDDLLHAGCGTPTLHHVPWMHSIWQLGYSVFLMRHSIGVLRLLAILQLQTMHLWHSTTHP